MANFFLNSYKKNIRINQNNNEENIETPSKSVTSYSFEKLEKIPIENNNNEKPKKTGYIQHEDITPIPKRRLSAIFLIASGVEKASKIVGTFKEKELLSISAEILSINGITSNELLLTEKFFGKLGVSDISGLKGTKEFLRNTLNTAFGITKGSELFMKVLEYRNERRFEFLEVLNPEQVVELLKEESPLIISIVLSLVQPKFAAQVLSALPRNISVEVVKSLSHKTDILPEILDTITSKIKDKTSKIKKDEPIELKGDKKLIELLKMMDPEASAQLVAELETVDTGLAKKIKDKIFSFADIPLIPKKSLEHSLKNYDDKDVAIILKGASEDIIKSFYSCISKRRREIVENEIKIVGPVNKDLISLKRKEFVFFLKQLADEGLIDITINREKYIT